MKIVRIEKSKHVQERVLVYLEEGDPLRITRNELLQFGLYRGMDLPPEVVVQLQNAGKRSQGRAAAARLASGRMMSRKELAERLDRKGIAPDTVAEAVDWLESLGAVDDAKEYFRQNPAAAEELEKAVRENFHKLMGNQSKIAARAAGRAVDVSADDFDDSDE